MKSSFSLFLRASVAAFLLVSAECAVFGENYYIKLTINRNNTAAGTVYMTDTDHDQSGYNEITTGSTAGGYADINITATPSTGYHFVSWGSCAVASGSTGNAEVMRDVESSTTNPTYVRLKAPSRPDKTNYYTLAANFAENYYTRLTASAGTGGSAAPTVSPSEYQNHASPNHGMGYTVTANGANSGYHFKDWTVTNNGSVSTVSGNPLNVTVNTAATGGQANATLCSVVANYELNEYYAKVIATSGGNGTITVSPNTAKKGSSAGADVEFTISTVPSTNYHLESITFTQGTGFISSDKTKVTVKAASGDNFGSANAATYTINATFAQDRFNAKLNTSVSTALSGTSAGTAKISSDGGTTYTQDSYTLAASTSGGNVTFKIKASPNKGYQFKGWSENNGSTTYKTTTAQTDYIVKGHTTEGSMSEYNLYAVFDKGTYTVHFNSGSGSGHEATGSMTDQSFTSGVAQNIKTNAFVCNYTVTYDAQGGTCSVPSETKSRFSEWTDGGSGHYADGASLNRMENHGSTVNLTANWANSVNFTLPTPTKQKDGVSKTFLGWYDAAVGGNLVGAAGAAVSISSTRTLYAHWKECSITITTSGATSGRVIFNVLRSGTPATHYRISIPATGSKTLFDVPSGDYTITPETDWSWNLNVSPSSRNISFDPSSAVSQTLTADFTTAPGGSTKKHDESSSTITVE